MGRERGPWWGVFVALVLVASACGSGGGDDDEGGGGGASGGASGEDSTEIPLAPEIGATVDRDDPALGTTLNPAPLGTWFDFEVGWFRITAVEETSEGWPADTGLMRRDDLQRLLEVSDAPSDSRPTIITSEFRFLPDDRDKFIREFVYSLVDVEVAGTTGIGADNARRGVECLMPEIDTSGPEFNPSPDQPTDQEYVQRTCRFVAPGEMVMGTTGSRRAIYDPAGGASSGAGSSDDADEDAGQSGDPIEVPDAPRIVAGDFHSCRIEDDGATGCWGQGPQGRSITGVQRAIASGASINCAIDEDDEMTCWGSGLEGADIGQVPGTYDRFLGGGLCARTTDGIATCMAFDRGRSSFEFTPVAGAPDEPLDDLAQAGGVACGILSGDGEISCWEPPSDDFPAIPLSLDDLDVPSGPFTAIRSMRGGFCAVSDEQDLTCWGDEARFVGDAPEGRYVSLSSAGDGACAVGVEGQIDCWGFNTGGRTTAPAGRFVEVAIGGQHTCAITEQGETTCWGKNDAGQSTPP